MLTLSVWLLLYMPKRVILTVKMATQTVARMKPFDDLKPSSQGCFPGPLSALSGSCAMPHVRITNLTQGRREMINPQIRTAAEML